MKIKCGPWKVANKKKENIQTHTFAHTLCAKLILHSFCSFAGHVHCSHFQWAKVIQMELNFLHYCYALECLWLSLPGLCLLQFQFFHVCVWIFHRLSFLKQNCSINIATKIKCHEWFIELLFHNNHLAMPKIKPSLLLAICRNLNNLFCNVCVHR